MAMTIYQLTVSLAVLVYVLDGQPSLVPMDPLSTPNAFSAGIRTGNDLTL